MDIRVLRYFVTIAREQNMSKAARMLHVSQPALSKQISELEAELGIKLFERKHRHIQLTQEGYYLLERAEEIIGLVNKTTYNLQKQDVVSGTLDIGAGESIAIKYVMEAVKNILHKYPEVHINLHSGDGEEILSELDSGVLEFGVIMGHRDLSNYNTLVLPAKNRWGVIMREDEQLAHQKSIQPSDLLGRTLITSRQAKEHQLLNQWSNGLYEQFNFVGSYNLIFNAALLVKTGACMALTYDDLIDSPSNTGLVFRPLEPELTDPNTLIWSKDRHLPNVGKLFLDDLQTTIKKNTP
ncbi:LysR family transcriptional regulator [Companilactobacillus halodurans]|uniref:LysR family transcriptional regulator n=1 Tax=Companilactobacillus halodurans TaxID=2584183 RepID=A0A5P0ZWT8_9LACO|nr:LysR family transcriptional regulator [Companilactobacillus halodurans]MQS76199.1 LysR family transcriptional regulator [Companilactobacillus halodurans]MQS97427.1 LysR family transcriptional regulator [Companilactobacillus halodurans]